MRILFLTAQPPEPAHAGGSLRTSGLMRGAHAAGHRLHLLTFAESVAAEVARPALSAYCARAELVPPPARRAADRLRDLLLSTQPDMQRRFYSADYTARLEALLAAEAYDLIQIESLEMATYLPVIKARQPHAKVIYDSFNAEFDLQRSIYLAERRAPKRLPGAVYSLIQWRRLVRFEREVCHTVDYIIAVSEADAAAFRRLAPGRPVAVVPNGIDTAPYARSDASLDLGPAALVFTGSMSYRPNVDAALWFADEVLPKIREAVPGATFFIVGSQPHARLQPLRERDGVQITGWVPDVNPFLHAAAVFVVPLRMGSGTRLKILQAMAAGRAVVSTTLGAQGLDAQDGIALRLADSAAEFARQVVALLRDPDQRCALGRAGAELVARQYEWSVIVPRLLEVYRTLVPDA
ncbi:MAG: glycosyltransferase [Anaerolineae bacterium]|nr:glycosyltransferase [Anaerolineae bacterium]